MGSRVNVSVLILAQGHGCTLRGGHYEESIMMGCLHFTAQIFRLIRGQTICNLVHYFVIYFVPLTIYLPLSLQCVSFCPIHIPWHQLDCACKYIIISSWSVPFIFGWALGLNASSLEALPHLLNIGRDTPKMRIRMHHGEKVNQKFWSPPKQDVMGKTSCHRRFRPIVRSCQTWHRITMQCALMHVRE